MDKYKYRITAREDASEIIRYDFEDYFAYAHYGKISWFPRYSADSHWHEDFEFIVVLSGHMLYNVNGSITKLNAGEGIFVNARQLHYGFSSDDTECDYICVLLHPLLLCASRQVEKKFVTPVITDSPQPYVEFHQDVDWESRIIAHIKKIYECREQPCAMLQIQSLFFQLWMELFENVFQYQQRSKRRPMKNDLQLSTLKNMISYIQQNYREKLTLEDIAKSGLISKSSALSLFKKFLCETPVNFLIEYRLKMAAKLLQFSNMTITEITYEIGFASPSYFTETFRKYYNCSPLEYRKREQ